MKILVVYSSKYGATRGIAEKIAGTLVTGGHQSVAVPVGRTGDLEAYDAYVIGSAAYMFSWRHDATDFVRRHAALLKKKPVWLFSSGPIGTEKFDAQGRDVLTTTVPKEIAELSALIQPREHKVFFGAFDHKQLTGVHRVVYALPAMKKLLVDGDYRDWEDIGVWAASIAAALEPVGATRS